MGSGPALERERAPASVQAQAADLVLALDSEQERDSDWARERVQAQERERGQDLEPELARRRVPDWELALVAAVLALWANISNHMGEWLSRSSSQCDVFFSLTCSAAGVRVERTRSVTGR